MTNYLLTGGGTAGHVNPLLALAEYIREHESDANILALGTKEGLESTLVPARNFELVTIAKLPFPRKPSGYALAFPLRFLKAVSEVRKLIRKREITAVVGFGGYASAPAYLAARFERIPLVVHEANALPGIANKIGARFADRVAVAFRSTPLANAELVGMPLRQEIVTAAMVRDKTYARKHFGLEPDGLTLLVTGGSLGAQRINSAIVDSLPLLLAAGIQVIHIVGGKSELEPLKQKGYLRIKYCERMDLAMSAADFAVSRAGASTVAELTALGIPALYVPYAVGNGEQSRNLIEVIAAGGGVSVADGEFNRDYIASQLIPILSSASKLAEMASAAASVGIAKGTENLYQLLKGVLAK